MSRTLVLASGNRGKLAELAELLGPMGFELRPQSEWDFPEAVESAPSFVENALIKARHASRHTGLPSIADDSGLVVPALGGAPGVHSARYAGLHGDDGANNEKLLAEMASLPDQQRAAYFYCAMVLVRAGDDPVPLVATASWHGEIARAPRGSGGFGYDPLFLLRSLGRTSAELPAKEKNRLSHRGRAAARLAEMLASAEAGR